MAVGVALILIGAVLLVGPFAGSSAPWDWQTKTLSDLEGAKINATPGGTGPEGVRLKRQGDRPVSLISPPLTLAPDVGRIVEVVASIPDAESASEQTVIFLWQTEETEGYRYEPALARLGPEPAIVRFSLSIPPEALHRIGFQFPDASSDVVIGRMAFPSLTLSERMALAASQATQREPFAAHSINFLRGPSILGNGVTSYLFGIMAMGAGIAMLIAGARRKRVSILVLVGVIVAVWALEDARATWNLRHNADEEIERFARAESRVDKWAIAQGSYEIAWVADLLIENADAGSTFCVVSDDAFTIPHRLAYLVAPKLAKVDDCKQAEFLIVIFSATARFDPEEQILTLPDESMIDARPVAQLSDYVYILRSNAK